MFKAGSHVTCLGIGLRSYVGHPRAIFRGRSPGCSEPVLWGGARWRDEEAGHPTRSLTLGVWGSPSALLAPFSQQDDLWEGRRVGLTPRHEAGGSGAHAGPCARGCPREWPSKGTPSPLSAPGPVWTPSLGLLALRYQLGLANGDIAGGGMGRRGRPGRSRP